MKVSQRRWFAGFCTALAIFGCGARSELDDWWGGLGAPPPGATADAGPEDATLPRDGSSADGPLPVDDGTADSLFPTDGGTADGTLAVDGSSMEDGAADPPATVSSALQIDPAHDGTIDDPLLIGPLTRLWSVTLPGPVSYPIIARDIVVVVTSSSDGAAQLLAFHGHTGVPAWGPIVLESHTEYPGPFAAATYENGRVFRRRTTESFARSTSPQARHCGRPPRRKWGKLRLQRQQRMMA
jgi:hypothetical protein